MGIHITESSGLKFIVKIVDFRLPADRDSWQIPRIRPYHKTLPTIPNGATRLRQS